MTQTTQTLNTHGLRPYVSSQGWQRGITEYIVADVTMTQSKRRIGFSVRLCSPVFGMSQDQREQLAQALEAKARALRGDVSGLVYNDGLPHNANWPEDGWDQVRTAVLEYGEERNFLMAAVWPDGRWAVYSATREEYANAPGGGHVRLESGTSQKPEESAAAALARITG